MAFFTLQRQEDVRKVYKAITTDINHKLRISVQACTLIAAGRVKVTAAVVLRKESLDRPHTQPGLYYHIVENSKPCYFL
jgi:hypothetical protein